MKRYDAIIIGTGQAGVPLAAALAEKGQKVAVAEGNLVGGSCVNYGCTPSKTLIASAKVAHMARQGDKYGVGVGDVQIDFAKVMERVHDRVRRSREGGEKRLANYPNIDLYRVYASFEGTQDGHHRVRMGDEVIEAPKVFLNTGARTNIPKVNGLDDVPYLTAENIFHLKAVPPHLIALGGGYISLELGQAFYYLGSQLTVIESKPTLVGREDDDVIKAVSDLFKSSKTRIGIDTHTGVKVVRVAKHGADQVEVTLESANGKQSSVIGSHLLVAVGRLPNSNNLNLESVGVKTDERGYITVDDYLQTNIDGIYALGDVNGRGAFTHTSYQDYEIMLDRLNGGTRSLKNRIPVYSMFIDPPLGRVGMNEKEARESGKNVLQAVYQMKWVSRAKEQGETDGLIKLLVDADSEQFLGATVFGFHGDEVTQIISYFMHTGASYRVMQNALPIHPTVGEFLPTILGELKPLQ